MLEKKIYACIVKDGTCNIGTYAHPRDRRAPHLLLCFQLEVVVVEDVGPAQGGHGCARRQRQPSSPAPRLTVRLRRPFLLLPFRIALIREISTPGRG